MNKKQSSNGSKIAAGLGVAALTAGAIGAYLYGTQHGTKNRKKIQSWMLKAKGEVLERLEGIAGDLNEDTYRKVVDEVASRYKTVGGVATADIKGFADDMLAHWSDFKVDIMGATMGETRGGKSKASKAKRSNASHKTKK